MYLCFCAVYVCKKVVKEKLLRKVILHQIGLKVMTNAAKAPWEEIQVCKVH